MDLQEQPERAEKCIPSECPQLEKVKKLITILYKLAYPDKYAPGYDHWFTGDGPAEEYFSELEREARLLLDGEK